MRTPRWREIRTLRAFERRTAAIAPADLSGHARGKLQLLKLRTDLQARQGAAFSLHGFHDEFMRQGFPPLAIVRRGLLGDDSPTL
ncbi:MAG: DUF885 family protein [Gammaproteobacteria bacterium]|nr:DUF885 family protein [Gammaproteobacteria bacterium]